MSSHTSESGQLMRMIYLKMIGRVNSLNWLLDWSLNGLSLLFLIKRDLKEIFANLLNNNVRKMKKINQVNVKRRSLNKRKYKQNIRYLLEVDWIISFRSLDLR